MSIHIFAVMKHLLLSALLLAGLVGCSKSNEATPTTPANTLQLTVKSKRLVFPVSAATLIISKQGSLLELTAATLDVTTNNIKIQASSNKTSLESPGFYSGDLSNPSSAGSASSMYGYQVPADFKNACGVDIYKNDYITYYTGVIPAAFTAQPNFTLTINTVDTGAHTMSGTFIGTYWKGCDKLEITDGQFNLPYTIQP